MMDMRQEKGLGILSYISRIIHDPYRIWITMYHADKVHLSSYGRPLNNFSEKYIKCNCFTIYPLFSMKILNNFFVQFEIDSMGNIFALDEINFNYLSESDIECIDKSINKFSDHPPSFARKYIVSDGAFQLTETGMSIDWKDIVLSLHNGKEVWDYINS